MKRHPKRSLVLAPILFLFLIAIAGAQTRNCDTCYRHYEYDSTLRFGAHLINNARVAVDELKLDYGQYYGKSFHELASQVRDTGNDWASSWNHKFYDTVDQKSFKTIFVPEHVDRVMDNSATVENYFGKDCRPDCNGKTTGWDAATLQAYDLWTNRTNGLVADSLWHKKIWGYTVPASDTARLIGGGPRYASHVTGGGKVELWQDLYGVRDSYGNLTFSPTKDSSKYLSLTVSLKAGPTLQTDPRFDDSTRIAYIVRYKRYLGGQGDRNQYVLAHCMCDIFQPWDTVYITRSMYNGPLTPTLQRTDRSDPTTSYHDVVAAIFKWDATTLPPPGWNGQVNSWWYGDPTDSDPCRSYCQDSVLPLAPAGSIADNLPESDLNFRVYSTGVVPITVLRTRVARYGFEKLKTGGLDTYLKADIDTADANAKVKKMLWQISPDDEPEIEQFRALGLISQSLQRSMQITGDTTRKIWVNAIKNYDGVELLSQDADVNGLKLVHTLVPQSYIDGGAVPIFYANPDSMDAAAVTNFYRTSQGPDTITGLYSDPDTKVLDRSRTMSMPRPKGIRFNTLSEYGTYTTDRQREFGMFSHSKGSDGVTSGYFVEYAARAVDVGHFKYTAFGIPSIPVHPVVRVHGEIGSAKDIHGNLGFAVPLLLNPPTAEEITCRSWLAMNCGADGIVFSDFIYDGVNFGVMNTFTGDHSAEYDTLRMPKPEDYNANPSGWTTPKMWVGFRSRFSAVQRVVAELRKLDTLVGWHKLLFNQEQMSLHDTSQHFAAMPVLDTVYTRQAKLRDLASGNYIDSVNSSNALLAYDPRSATYMEVSHFRPGSSDTNRTSHYFLFTNRRTWPNDQTHYSSSAQTLGADPYGLGYIDVRRPVVRFKNETGTLADSFLVVRIGHESEWPSRKVRAGDSIELDWLTPGWGALYRVTPIRRGISPVGTAYNNAVRSVSLTDSVKRGQVVTYERDSIVYAMTMDSSGKWSREFQISDAADASTSGRTAYNMFPSVAPIRNGTAWIFAWERYNVSTGKTSVEARYYPRFPNPDSLFVSSRVSALAAARTLSGAYHLTPAVTGADSGFVVAWATPDSGIAAVAIPTHVPFKVAEISSVVLSRGIIPYMGLSKDTLFQYPTLAYVPNYNGTNQTVHMAWQENYSAGTTIFYRQLQARFPVSGQASLAAIAAAENVTTGMAGCQFINPCIAADSVRVGVAFQSVWPSYRGKATPPGGVSVISLRFRDSTALKAGWQTPAYHWGDDSSWYERPTMTEFPTAPRSALTGGSGHPEGALAWFRVKGASSNPGANQLYFYRFGKVSVNRVHEGKHPSMTQVPFRRTAPYMTQSSLLYRDGDVRQFLGKPSYSTNNVDYVDGLLMNHPSSPDTNFTTAAGDSIRLFAGNTLRTVMTGRFPSAGPCARPSFVGGIGFEAWHMSTELDPGTIFPAAVGVDKPTLPPLFFAPPEGGTFIETLEDATSVSRTSAFLAGPSPVTLRRLVYGTDNLTDWLNTEPYDVGAGEPANVRAYLELVRNVDNVVLWRGDTVTARAVTGTSYDDLVSVPVEVVPLGTKVFIRMRMQPTTGIADTSYDVSAGFYGETDSTERGFMKLIRYSSEKTTGAGGTPAAAGTLGMAIVPNPTSSVAEIRVTATEAGPLDLEIFDVMGNRVRSIPPASIGGAGEYVVTIDVHGLAAGVYTVRARLGGSRQTTGQLTVTR